MRSRIYEGVVRHRRFEPVAHAFQYRLFMVCLALDELPRLTGRDGMISASRHRSSSFLRRDHLYGRAGSLDQELRDLVQERTGCRPRGRIELLTQLRYFGYYLSPLNLYFVYSADAPSQVELVVAEVNNTPWNERHCYVLHNGNRTPDDQSLAYRHPKRFHVSPFMDMEMDYQWRIGEPGDELSVSLENYVGPRRLFGAGMDLRRRELSRRTLRRMTRRYPLMTAQIGAAIYYQALRLWWKKCPSFVHPRKKLSQPSSTGPACLPANSSSRARRPASAASGASSARPFTAASTSSRPGS